MAISSSKDLGHALHEYLEEGAKEIIGKVFDEAVEEAVKRVNEQRDEFIAKTAVKLRSWTQIEDMTNRVVITIEKPKDIL